jgi:hypothetical protein
LLFAPKAKKSAKPATAPKAARRTQKSADARTNKKAEVIAMMKSAKGTTLAEIADAGRHRRLQRGTQPVESDWCKKARSGHPDAVSKYAPAPPLAFRNSVELF